jgi:hypothetical protein
MVPSFARINIGINVGFSLHIFLSLKKRMPFRKY